MDCGCGSAFAPAGVLWEDEREENCIANPSRIEVPGVLGLANGHKAPCRHGLSCTRPEEQAGVANLVMSMEVMCSVQPREGVGSARTDGVRQLSGQRTKDSGPGGDKVADECQAS
jgi:hypothetical protein